MKVRVRIRTILLGLGIALLAVALALMVALGIGKGWHQPAEPRDIAIILGIGVPGALLTGFILGLGNGAE